MSTESEFAHRMLTADWQRIVLEICGAHRWSVASLARAVGSHGVHMNHIARGEVNEPRIKVALRLMAMHKRLSLDHPRLGTRNAHQAFMNNGT